MQYNSEILPYKRVKNVGVEQKEKKQIERLLILKNLIYFVSAMLVSRVLLLNEDSTTAPFGIALLIASVIQSRKIVIPMSLGCFAGYVSLYDKLTSLPEYLIIIASLMVLSYLLNRKNKIRNISIIFSIISLEILLSEFFIKHLTLNVAFLTMFLQMICIIPLYFILERSLICIKALKSKHLFTSEEIISISMLISLILAGTWGVEIFDVSIRNILALNFILMISYINGSNVGAASGIAIGSIIGISSENILIFMSVYGLCGLIAGIFKESGKVLTSASYVITFLILKLYSNIDVEFKLVEIIIATTIFLIIPAKVYDKINLELDWEKKQDYLNKNYINRIKDMLFQRLYGFSNVLYNISGNLNTLADNDKLVMKNKSSALIENLADRVCATCQMNSNCWKKETYITYTAFGELIQSHQEGNNKLPEEINRKCIKRTILLNNTKEIVNNYIINEMWRKRLSEGREIIAGQINNMASSLKEVMEEFNSDVKFNSDAEKRIRKIFENKTFKYKDIFCYEDKNNRLNVKLYLKSCGGAQLCSKKILPLINEAVEKNMCISDDGCVIDPKTSICTMTFEEAPKFYVSSYVGRQCKNGEKQNGDSYSFGKISDGSYMCIISDGMGSGPEASEESKIAVELIEKFTRFGISKATAINTVNSIMSLKFSENEKFSTLDLTSVDLYTGDTSFMKVGAVPSFVKSGKNVEVITSNTLPIGVLDKVDLEVTNKKLRNGDIIVMLSDGVLDYDNNNVGKIDWILDYLKNSNINSPKELVDGIISRAKELSGGRAKDDMTAIVCKVYSVY
ncbi:stage II sporulation protein E [Clostridium botulinum]|uniref:Stage II sporulation protein E n=1 Tax=Clostridium botulinum C/D str. DC5 TaxID=1443128 RepID=A0A0A0I3T7_CLOBO|nr:stage II sporulation protein E [Clostridium botulinum]KEI00737.1 stage II sporulation protein E [Clostridium botulinum C/D str. BKT75002]KEI08483.1 stage II sporulation protein E [Clostridium botulinum C/D str. BKT2873]KGM96059.1 stage II sporulation protein E [Clostridium botulinum C/D str. DC5]KOC51252.1 stage II sporulation protein E [Clostridium botulinum]KOC54989.1 stage II sporulation protein E [Clostridium botulinum]